MKKVVLESKKRKNPEITLNPVKFISSPTPLLVLFYAFLGLC